MIVLFAGAVFVFFLFFFPFFFDNRGRYAKKVGRPQRRSCDAFGLRRLVGLVGVIRCVQCVR